jgi:ABC-type dipeptide/oligopeptide/nickel transport system permease component
MIILASTILLTIIGIVLIVIYEINNNWWYDEWQLFLGITLSMFSGLLLIIELIILISKPLDYKNFKIEYETTTEIITFSDDIRDTNYTMKIIEINEEIKRNREYIDSPWIGIFYNKDIANMKLLNKE